MFDDRHPLRQKALWTAVVQAVVLVAVAAGIGAEVVEGFQAVGLAVIGLLMNVGILVKNNVADAEEVVTPLSDPRDNEGHQLVPKL